MRILAVSLLFLPLLSGCQTAPPAPAPREKQLFVVIDDAGLDLAETQQYLDLPIPLTIAVLPHLKDTREVCRAVARQDDKEMILHQPMEAYDSSKNPGQGAILSSTHPAAVKEILNWNRSSVKEAVGINNHMGSRITENPALMREVLQYCKANGLYFLDSKTAYNSVVPLVAAKEQMHLEQRDCFLDIQHDRVYIRRMWAEAVAKARENGYTIVIGHAWSAETANAIRDSYETLLNQGYTFHTLSELYR
jgi:polysaccharide deacetylase 2 family uncharacterized protein YibQ